MINEEEGEKLITGKDPKQIVFCCIEAGSAIPPTAVLNLYVNMGFKFIQMTQVFKKSESSIFANGNKQPVLCMHYYFSTILKNYQNKIGEYIFNAPIAFNLEAKK